MSWKPAKFGGFILYRIYYGDDIVYLGRTMQPLQDRIRGHLFKKPMHRAIYIDQVSKIEYAEFQTQADMYLYEIYFINLWKPPLNRDDKAHDELTVQLPDIEWKLFETKLWEKWKSEIAEQDREEEQLRKEKADFLKRDFEMRRKRRSGEITEDECFDFFERESKKFLWD